MPSLFFKSVAAGAVANLIITSRYDLHVQHPAQRQLTTLIMATGGFFHGIYTGDTAKTGFSVGMGAMALIQTAVVLMSSEENQAHEVSPVNCSISV